MPSQITDYSLVQFQPLDVTEEGSMDDILLYINHTIQYGEDLDVRIPTVSAKPGTTNFCCYPGSHFMYYQLSLQEKNTA